MFYGYETGTGRGYVRRIWTEEPDAAQVGDLEVLEVDHPNAPDEGFYRVANGQLVECPGTEEDCEKRRARMVAARAKQARARDSKKIRAEPGRSRRA